MPRYWVNTAALSLVVADTDFSYSGLGPHMAMTRTYNSNDYRPGMFGRGWSFSYEELVKTFVCSDNPAVVKKGAGNYIRFEKTTNFCPSGYVQPLTAIPSYPASSRDLLAYYHVAASPPALAYDYWVHRTKEDHTSYRYDWISGLPNWLLTSITDQNGHAATIDYNSTGTIQQITDATGRITSFAYDGNNRCISMTVPNNHSAYYEYDASGDLIKSTDLMGNQTFYTYDAEGYMLSMRVGNKATSFSYDASVAPKRLLTVTDAMGRTQVYQKGITADGNTAVDTLGNISYFAANDEGVSLSTADPAGKTTARQYTEGLLTSFTDSVGNEKHFGYDSRGNMTSRQRSGYLPTTYTYDASDNPLSKTDPLGNTWHYEYDNSHNLKKIQRPSAGTTTFSYSAGLLTAITDSLLETISFAYDQYGNVVSAQDKAGNITLMEYPAPGFLKTSE
ncbi:MAG: DUF6531 domain-containing protein, partial [Thermodesulfovibrionales bacterium]